MRKEGQCFWGSPALQRGQPPTPRPPAAASRAGGKLEKAQRAERLERVEGTQAPRCRVLSPRMGRQKEEGLNRTLGLPVGKKRGCCSGMAALLAASILSSFFQPTQAWEGVVVMLEPAIPIVGQDVTLIPRPEAKRGSYLYSRWYRKERQWLCPRTHELPKPDDNTERGSCGEEEGSLHVRNLMFSDSGTYFVYLNLTNTSMAGEVYLQVTDPAVPLPVLPLGIIIASLCLIAVAGSLFFYVLCIHHHHHDRHSDAHSTQMISTPSVCGDVPFPKAQPETCSDTNQK
ncbi:uncharacterized protein LOC128332880 [Hemicordylus capensis]|uniref:uncharacterized protein LOC128332880 n=1 Tax=Hemicordylus capensis TaxID=884348 RepID=UPI00230302FB|nr:uncharacterized protein LOC128332880 [Hemicordylus capensis]